VEATLLVKVTGSGRQPEVAVAEKEILWACEAVTQNSVTKRTIKVTMYLCFIGVGLGVINLESAGLINVFKCNPFLATSKRIYPNLNTN
jgi:hypothetical protein